MSEQTNDSVQDETLEMRMSRVLPATPAQVFDAYTDPQKQRAWFSILDEEPGIVEIDVDLRVGGSQTTVWGPSRDQLFREVQTFLVVDRPRRLVTESTGSSPEGMSMTTRIEVTFEAQGGATLMTVVQRGFPVPEVRDFFAAEVWVGALDRIEAYLRREGGAA